MDRYIPDIALIGMPGSGKTTIGRLLAERLQVDFCDVDEYIEKKYHDKIRNLYKGGEEHFRELETESIREIVNYSPKIIATGGGVIKSKENMDVLGENRLILFINRPMKEIIRDIDITRPLFDNREDKIYRLFKERYHLYKKYSQMEIINSGNIDLVVENIILELNKLMI